MKINEEFSLKELKSLKFFANLPANDLQEVIGVMELCRVKKGEAIISEEEEGRYFYILRSGKVNIVKKIDGDDLELINTIDNPGDFFGEMSLLEGKPRSAGVVAAADCELFVIPKDSFLGLAKKHPELTMYIAATISNFLRRADRNLVEKMRSKNAELVQAYNDLRRAQADLIQKERLSTIGRLASSIIHDIKNPMTSIRGYAQLLNECALPPEKIKSYSEVIMREVDRFIEMTTDLLTFSKGEIVIRKTPVELNYTLDDLLYGLKSKFEERKVEIMTDFQCPGKVNIDRAKFRRALENICYNALDAMPDGGKFILSTIEQDGQAVIALEDNGCGMTAEVREKIFEEFFSYNKTMGTGLGLAITKRIVCEHNGSIEVQSQVGKGTVFKVILPLIKSDI